MFKLDDDESNGEISVLSLRHDGALCCSFKNIPDHIRIVNYFGATEKAAYSSIEKFSFYTHWIVDHDLKDGQRLSYSVIYCSRDGKMVDVLYLYKVK